MIVEGTNANLEMFIICFGFSFLTKLSHLTLDGDGSIKLAESEECCVLALGCLDINILKFNFEASQLVAVKATRCGFDSHSMK